MILAVVMLLESEMGLNRGVQRSKNVILKSQRPGTDHDPDHDRGLLICSRSWSGSWSEFFRKRHGSWSLKIHWVLDHDRRFLQTLWKALDHDPRKYTEFWIMIDIFCKLSGRPLMPLVCSRSWSGSWSELFRSNDNDRSWSGSWSTIIKSRFFNLQN